MGSGQGSEVNAVSTFLSSSFFFVFFGILISSKEDVSPNGPPSIYLFIVHLDNSNTTNFLQPPIFAIAGTDSVSFPRADRP